jgi:hypothetical protein
MLVIMADAPAHDRVLFVLAGQIRLDWTFLDPASGQQSWLAHHQIGGLSEADGREGLRDLAGAWHRRERRYNLEMRWRFMTHSLRCTVIAILMWTSAAAEEAAPGYGPWKLGMSKKDVTAVRKYGPYKDVAITEGVETANGYFDNNRANVSFVFGVAGLRKIQIWAYEGRSLDDAAAAWFGVYDYFHRQYGQVESPVLGLPDPIERVAFIARVRELLSAKRGELVRLQMAPIPMPDGMKVFSSLLQDPLMGFYYAFVFYQQR